MAACALFFFPWNSFFDEQSGAFSIIIRDIRATSSPGASSSGLDSVHGKQASKDGDWHSDEEEEEELQKHTEESVAATNKRHSAPTGSPWWRGVFCGLL